MNQVFLFPVMLVLAVGCSTTRSTDTPRTALEQLLISNATDQALNKMDFQTLHQQSVYVQEKYCDGIDKNYLLASIRHRVLQSGARLVEKPDEADVVLEVRNGGIGTDRTEGFIGVPQIAVPLPLPVQLPELKLLNRKTQTATAKIGLVAYDAKTRQAIGEGSVSLAKSDDHNWYIFGIGPFTSGSVKEEVTAHTTQGKILSEVAASIPLYRNYVAQPPAISARTASAATAAGIEPLPPVEEDLAPVSITRKSDH